MRLDIVNGDDWQGVYLDGEMHAQDHSIREHHWLYLVEKAGSLCEDVEVHVWTADLDWLDSLGYLPHDFKDIPLDKISRDG